MTGFRINLAFIEGLTSLSTYFVAKNFNWSYIYTKFLHRANCISGEISNQDDPNFINDFIFIFL